MFRLPLSIHLPMFGFAAFAFLVVCAVLAIATFLVFRSGAQGETKLGGCAGCAIGFALLLMAGVAAAMCVAVMLVNTKSELLRHGPVRSLELDFDHDHEQAAPPGTPRSDSEDMDDDHDKHAAEGEPLHPAHGAPDPDHPVHLKLVVRGDEYPAAISEWVREHSEGDVSVTTRKEGDHTVIDFGLPFSREDLAGFKRDLREAMPGMKLPRGIKVEIKDGDDD
jgi:hypothetical protein